MYENNERGVFLELLKEAEKVWCSQRLPPFGLRGFSMARPKEPLQPNLVLHTENGKLEHSRYHNTWHSAMWMKIDMAKGYFALIKRWPPKNQIKKDTPRRFIL